MITLDELLIKIGVDGAQAQKISGYVDLLQTGADKIGESASAINEKLDGLLNEVSGSLDGASKTADKASKDITKTGDSAEKAGGKFSKLKLAVVASVGALMLFGNKIASAFNNAIDNAKSLFQSKNALYQISEDEISQVDRYKQSLERTSLSIDSVKTKIAINLIPTLTAVSEKFNGWLMVNKDFITNGITKTVEWIGKGIQVVTNFIKFIDKVISSTIGWKNAFIALGVAWAVLNRAFLFSPVGMIITAFGVLLLLIDDLMVYMRGGKSLFGTYWDSLIKGGKAVIKFFQEGEAIWKPILVGLVTYFTLLGSKGLFSAIVKNIKSIGTAFKALRAIMMANPIIAILTAIAVVAYLIYDNWDWLCEQFKNIWGNISKWAEEAWNAVTGYVRDAIKDVLMWFGMSEEGAEDTVNAIAGFFSLITDFIFAPFKAAFDLVKDLFEIWGDDSKTVPEKIKESFVAVFDYLISPFKKAMKWIKETFGGFIDTIVGNAIKALNYIPGVNIEYTPINGADENDMPASPSLAMSTMNAIADSKGEGVSPIYDYDNSSNDNGSYDYSNNVTNNYQSKNDDFLAMYGSIASIANGINVPSPVTNQNTTVRNDVKVDSKIEIHATDSLDGAKRAGNYLADQIGKASDFNKSAVRG
ncbi:hypothetical protein WMO13_06520 [Ignatzschineria larvae DSM 13226]|uniref:Phage-related protein n=1 Tax=Ignatzschineria larvae DSM 13226 TaxID=1111732 RepID=A0ABZ3BXY5_9GAMM|nr:hypothetical protein [Ignatzschineria larvae]